MSKIAFVTGATGCLGLNLIEQLLDQRWQVIAMHRRESDASVLEPYKVTRVLGDITEARSLRGLIPDGVDCVFHVAGNTSLWSKAHAEQFRVNVKGTRNMVKAALDANAQRFVHTSSIVAYGFHGGTISEETPTRGTAAKVNYVRSKALAEREVRRGISRGLKAVIVNPSNIIGAYDNSNWSRMFVLLQRGRLPAITAGGGSFCHAQEVAKAHIAAAEKGRVGANYLLGGAEASYRVLAKKISEVLGVKRRVVSLPPAVLGSYARIEEFVAPLFGREPDFTRDAVELLSQNFYCDSRRAIKELNYEPQSLEVMVKDCYQWLRKQKRL